MKAGEDVGRVLRRVVVRCYEIIGRIESISRGLVEVYRFQSHLPITTDTRSSLAKQKMRFTRGIVTKPLETRPSV